MRSSMLIFWTILPLFFQTSYAGAFHRLYSSISTAGHTHGCVGELLTFTCTTSGAWMEWKLVAGTQTYRERFVYSDEVNKVLPDSTFEDVTAILLEIHANMTSMEANFTSVIFIKLTNNTLPGNITCSSSADNATLQYGIADTPRPPDLTTITQLALIGTPDTNNSVLYHIQWIQPNNVEAFDLDHYELIVGNHTMNIDAEETAVIISLIMKKETILFAYIMAVDRCGKKSNRSSKAISGLTESRGLNGTSIISCTCTCVREVVLSTILTLIVTVTVVIIISIMVIIISCTKRQKCSHTVTEDQQAHTESGVHIDNEGQEENNDDTRNDPQVKREENTTAESSLALLAVKKIKREDSGNYSRQRSSSTASYQRLSGQ